MADTTPYDFEISKLEASIHIAGLKLKILKDKKDQLGKVRGKLNVALAAWTKQLIPFAQNIGLHKYYNGAHNAMPYFSTYLNKGAFGLVIYPHEYSVYTGREDAEEFVNITSFDEYVLCDADSTPLTFAADTIDALMPKNNILNKHISFNILTYDLKQRKYISIN